MTPSDRASRALSALMHQDFAESDGEHNKDRCLACQLHAAVVREIEEAEAEARQMYQTERLRLLMAKDVEDFKSIIECKDQPHA